MGCDTPDGYMNALQLEHFKNRLLNWKQDILENKQRKKYENNHFIKSDVEFLDVVARQISQNIEIIEQENEVKTLQNIEKALQRIKDKRYGYCDESGEPIGIKRLEANPIATLSIEAQTFLENRKKIHISAS